MTFTAPGHAQMTGAELIFQTRIRAPVVQHLQQLLFALALPAGATLGGFLLVEGPFRVFLLFAGLSGLLLLLRRIAAKAVASAARFLAGRPVSARRAVRIQNISCFFVSAIP